MIVWHQIMLVLKKNGNHILQNLHNYIIIYLLLYFFTFQMLNYLR